VASLHDTVIVMVSRNKSLLNLVVIKLVASLVTSVTIQALSTNDMQLLRQHKYGQPAHPYHAALPSVTLLLCQYYKYPLLVIDNLSGQFSQ